MAVDATGAVGTTGGATAGGRAMLATNYETFLQLLTAQLKNQDPLSPVDSNAFTAQLVQMAGVEQQLLTNDLLEALVNQGGGGLDAAVQYIGKDVTAAGSAVRLDDGAARWSYELATDAADVRLEVLNSQGQVVWSGAAPETGDGVHDFNWDGRSTSGVQQPDGGVYTLRVASATNAAGATVDSQVLIRGRVTAVEMYDGTPYLTVGGSIVPITQVISVQQGAQAQTVPEDEPESPGALAAMGSAALDLLNPVDEIRALAGAINPLRLF